MVDKFQCQTKGENKLSKLEFDLRPSIDQLFLFWSQLHFKVKIGTMD